jgi:hypothetical protein
MGRLGGIPAGELADEQSIEMGVPVPQVRCLADVEPQPVRWLWPGRIALGKLTLICGDPGLGKSFLTLDLAARVTAGRGWPDGAAASTDGPGSAVLITAEDDLADTVRPRLDAAGADVSRVVALDSVAWRDARGVVRHRPFALEDVGAVAAVVRRTPDCRLLVIDPVSAFVGGCDSHNNAEVRGLLAPLSKLAADLGVAVVAVTHLSKGGGNGRAIYRAMGSLAFVAAARCAWLVARDGRRPDRRLFLPIKNNLADDQAGLAYGIVGGALAWEPDPVTDRADDVLMSPGGGDESPVRPGPAQTARAEAGAWLRDLLSAGPVAAAQVRHEAEAMGFALSALRRAREDLGVRTTRPAFDRPWFWQLPAATTAADGTAPARPDNLLKFDKLDESGDPSAKTGEENASGREESSAGTTPGSSSSPSPRDPTSASRVVIVFPPNLTKSTRLSGSNNSPAGGTGIARPPRFQGPYGLPDAR